MSPRGRGRGRGGSLTSDSLLRLLVTLAVAVAIATAMTGHVVMAEDMAQDTAQDEEGQVAQPTRRQSLKESFLNAETVAVVNLLSSILLLAVVYLVLGPILDGSVSIIRNDNRRAGIDADSADSAYSNWAWPSAGNGEAAYDPSRSSDANAFNAYNTNFDQASAATTATAAGGGTGVGVGSAQGQQHYYNDWDWQQSARSGGVASLWRRAAKAIQSVDPLSLAWSAAAVGPSEVCRQRALCEAAAASASGRAAAVLQPAIKMIGTVFSRFEGYSVAMDLGRSGQDCASLFADCQLQQGQWQPKM